MSLIDINLKPDKRKLREFGIAALIAGLAISLLLYFLKGLALKWVLPIFIAGLVIFTLSLISVKITRLVYIGLMVITLPIGIVVSFLVLTLFYFLLLVPLGLIFRITGRDVLHRRFDKDAQTYWQKRKRTENTEHYFHQF